MFNSLYLSNSIYRAKKNDVMATRREATKEMLDG